jgi:hypothetical protein
MYASAAIADNAMPTTIPIAVMPAKSVFISFLLHPPRVFSEHIVPHFEMP